MYPWARAAGWDAVGLQVGDASAEVTSVAVCHEVTEAVTAAVESDPVDLLIAYHPLLFRPIRALVAGTSPEGRAFRLARSGVAMAAVHTAFDVAPGGAADALAVALGLTRLSGFGPAWPAAALKFVTFVPPEHVDAVVAAATDAGAGTIGNYRACSFRAAGEGTFFPLQGTQPVAGSVGSLNVANETRVEIIATRSARDRVAAALVAAHPYEEPAYDVYEVEANAAMIGRVGVLEAPVPLEEFAGTVGTRLGAAVRFAGDPSLPVERVAVVPGSGSSLIPVAAARADVLVSGDVKHHQARDALDRGLAVIDAGHAPTERPGLQSLYASVSEIVPATRDLRTIDPHPWRELGWRS